MDFIDKIKEIATRIEKQKEFTKTEEATKNAFILPFINALGYDVFNPTEVIPEYIADIGKKKGEKVDFAIKKDDAIIILIECKCDEEDLLEEHTTQLRRYFNVTPTARFAILTNGIIYKFYSDLVINNNMDSKPFFEFNVLKFEDHQIKELKKFTKSTFSLDDILTTASTLKYTGAIKKILEKELDRPSEPFVRFFASQVYDGKLMKSVIDNFTIIVKNAQNQFIKDQLNDVLNSAKSTLSSSMQENFENIEVAEQLVNDNGIVTTEEEIAAYNIVKAISYEVVDVNRVFMRDTKSYCGVLLDNNNRKPVCRLHFNASQKYIGVFSNKNEERIPIDGLNDIFKHANKIKSAIQEYDA